jgi:hypothetical protein
VLTAFLKFGASTVMSYVLTGTLGALNSPSSFDVTVRNTELSFDGSVIVTVAPGTTAPAESLTEPTIDPEISCPIARLLKQSDIAKANKIDVHVFLLVIVSFLFLKVQKFSSAGIRII